MCQEICVVNEYGTVIGELKDGKIVIHYEDTYGLVHENVLYDQPFDIQYALTLMSLYRQTCKYLNLPEEIHDKANRSFGDYRTACKLELIRRQ